MTQTTCVADHCKYWIEGNRCIAPSITVTNLEGKRAADTVDETMCETFAAKEDSKAVQAFKDFMENFGPDPKVKCIVDSCEYWEDGDHCSADEITILGEGVHSEENTACETYEQM